MNLQTRTLLKIGYLVGAGCALMIVVATLIAREQLKQEAMATAREMTFHHAGAISVQLGDAMAAADAGVGARH